MSRSVRVLGRIGRWLAIGLLAVAVLSILLVGALLLALRSDTGTAWVLDQIPGLETTGADGSVLGEWQAERLSWQGYGVSLVVADPYLDWSPTCLFRKTLCIDRLQTGSVNLDVQPGPADEPSEPAPITLPDIRLPVSLDVGSVDIGPLTLNDSLVFRELNLEAEGSGADFHIQKLAVVRDDLQLEASGRIETRGDWPLALDLSLELPPPYGDEWEVSGRLGGSVRDLRAYLDSQGYLDGELEAELAPLSPGVPVQLELTADRFLALDTLPPTLALNDWRVTGRGNLNDGYRIQTRASLPGEQGAIDLDLSGLVSTSGARDLALRLAGPSATGDGSAELEMTGQVSWDDGLAAEAEISMGAFPWYSLLPDVEAPPATIRSLEATGSYSDGRYQARLEVDAEGPMGEATLETRAEGDLEQVRLTGLNMTTGAGQLSGEAELGFAGEIRWRADLGLTDFDPGYWVPEATAQINGSVFSEGRIDASGQPDFTARWDLEGEWRSAPLDSEGQLSAEAGQWQIPEVVARIGSNEVRASGELSNPLGGKGEMSVRAQVQAPEPGVILPGLSGSLQADVELSGPFTDPQGALTLAMDELAWRDQLAIERLNLEATISPGQAVDATVEAESLEAGGQVIERLSADLEGTLDRHRLSLSVRHPEAIIDTEVAGGWQAEEGNWLGELASGRVELPGQGQEWVLADPASIEYTGGDTLTLGAHCWRWQQSSVCAGEQTLLPDPSLDYDISRLPASSLAPLLPETIRWDAELNARMNVELTDQGPKGRVTVDAGPGEVDVVTAEDWETLGYDALDLTLDLEPSQAVMTLNLAGKEIGNLDMELSLDPLAEGMPAEGNFSLTGFDLALVGALLNMEEVSGMVEGSGRIEGPLMDPRVYGELRLENGQVIDPMVPTPVEDLAVTLAFDGKRATLDGRWRSNGTGQGEIGGVLDWEEEPVLTMVLEGQALPVTYEPYARLEVSPDLELRFVDGNLSIAGQVDVPRGSIEVRELPEQAVEVSDDEVIVGVEEEPSPVRQLDMDIRVSVGSDKVTFEGFGVTGELVGELRIGDGMDTRGNLKLVNGRYAKFGQELELRRARLVFVGPISEPYVDIEAIRRVDDVLAGIRLSGPAREPRTEVFSEPSMSQNEALSYLILGRPLQSQGDQGSMSRVALSLGLRQASGLTRGVGEAFGIEDLTLEAEGSGEEAAVVASGQLTEDLSIRYGVGLFEPITTVALRYDLGRYFYLEAASGLASSLDIFYTRDF
ncbi:translocation and assembly module TamB [Marinobacter daqiaonensis]|uniref:Translocation and assembly module TamB n=1 Tax=Marinobacter daqiaonensis TaxID=650891 RepID=A0A1I6H7E5_9GAMM|nr:translocation/assembly module TamB domain-containing protein [Marinobacter daqiaonensis]SFR50362.1 translocation and assembly module TamB [Marinobacter daqiaonensis]